MGQVVLSALLSHWRRHPLQLGSFLLGLALATALWSGVQAINAEARASYGRAAALLGQDRYAQLVSADGQRFDQAVYVALRRAGWQVSPMIEGSLRRDGQELRVLGVEPLSAPQGAAPETGGAGPGAMLEFITPPGLGYAAPSTVRRLQGVEGVPPLTPSNDMQPGVVIVDIGIAQRLFEAPGQISALIVHPEQPMGRAPLAQVAPGLVERPPQVEADIAALTDSFHLNLTAFGLLSFAVGLFIVHGAIGLAFEQRRPVFRTLRAIGVPLRTLVVVLLAEVLVLGLIAGALGVALGYGVAAALLPDVAATLRGLYGAEVPGTLALRPSWWLGGLGIAVLGAGAAAGQSLWRLARLPVLAPAQPRAWARASARALRRQSVLAVALLMAAGGLATVADGVVMGFAMLGALLLGAALMLPVVLVVLLRIAGRFARGPLSQWFWADTRQQVPGLSLALMALLLALAANVGVGTMVSSFRLTFLGWLDQRLASELYVTARTEDEASRLRDWLAPRSDAVLPIWSVETQAAGMPVFVYGVADHATYRDHWPLLQARPGAWDALARGNGVLINEQMARRAGLAAGDVLALPAVGALRVVGVYSDYGNPTGQALIGIERFAASYPQAPRLRHAVRVPPAQVGPLAAQLVSDFGLPAANVVDQAQVKASSRAVFERTFAVTAALNVLTLAVAGFAMLTSLLTLSAMRLPQLAPVWALGLGRRPLARLELLRALLLSALTMVAAVPVGLALAWALLAVVNVAAFGWRLPMYLFPFDWLRLAALAVLAGGLAALWPALRLSRMAPGDLLKVFAHER